jgi:3-phosphoshikimate 1-carboxyvinyltransferase
MKNVISAPLKAVKDTIHIPSSKSISNRMLIIHALAGSAAPLRNLSGSDDTAVLRKALETESDVKDVGHAGTSMRFLAAYFSVRQGQVVLTGSQRMKQRPIGPLVDALKQIGARIEFLENEGYPPLRITGGSLKGGSIEIEAGISSQFISALMMIGPQLEGGLTIHLKGRVVSAAYIEMTLALMNRCGADASFDGKHIQVLQRTYRVGDFQVESDWSAASYWYQVAALLPGSEILLPNLSGESLQGDAALIQIFRPLGVRTSIRESGILLHSEQKEMPDRYSYDFTSCPDLVQTLSVSLCVLGVPFRLTGTSTLRVKETDRIAALQAELRKVGFVLQADPQGEWLEWDGSRCEPEPGPLIQTYHDHRMAMAFAPLAITCGSIAIEDPGVVSKSYPDFWADLEKAGFGITVQS